MHHSVLGISKYTPCLFTFQNCLIIECYNDDDCTGDSDTCSSHSCRCGSSKKCSGNTDTCVMGECKCGQHDECSETEFCANGECKGIWSSISKRNVFKSSIYNTI